MPYEPGQLILNGKYRIEAFIGQGAFAQVYRAAHIDLNAPRAIKVLDHNSPGVGSSDIAEYRKRFQLEKQLGAKIHHVNVIEVYDSGTEDDKVMLVMEYAAGGSLAQKLNQANESNTPLTMDECVSIALGVAEGLSAIHALDVVHRDIKPSNILFNAQGRVKVADLGLAQSQVGGSLRSQMGSAATFHPGTPAYMSPEQETTVAYLRPTSDVYTLGLVIFEILTDRNYKNLSPDTRAKRLRADTPAWLDALVARMLAHEPQSRPWDGAKVAELLRAGAKHKPVLSVWQTQLHAAQVGALAAAERIRLADARRQAQQAEKRKASEELAQKKEEELRIATIANQAQQQTERKAAAESERIKEETRQKAAAERKAQIDAESVAAAERARLKKEQRSKNTEELRARFHAFVARVPRLGLRVLPYALIALVVLAMVFVLSKAAAPVATPTTDSRVVQFVPVTDTLVVVLPTATIAPTDKPMLTTPTYGATSTPILTDALVPPTPTHMATVQPTPTASRTLESTATPTPLPTKTSTLSVTRTSVPAKPPTPTASIVGEGSTRVSGRVTWNNQPLAGIEVSFGDANETISVSTTGSNGEFIFRAPNPGKYCINIKDILDVYYYDSEYKCFDVLPSQEIFIGDFSPVKEDIVQVSPINLQVSSIQPTLIWQPYPSAHHYSVNVYHWPDNREYHGLTVTSITMDRPLTYQDVTYIWFVEAYDANNVRIATTRSKAQSLDAYRFKTPK